jgi:hypothetical protein
MRCLDKSFIAQVEAVMANEDMNPAWKLRRIGALCAFDENKHNACKIYRERLQPVSIKR